MRASAGVLLGCVVAAACSDGVTPPPAAERLCHAAYDRATVTAAFPTTVGEVRSLTAGPGLRPAASAWPGTPDAAAAAWCYVRNAEGPFVGVAVEGAAPFVFARGDMSPSPDGPRIP